MMTAPLACIAPILLVAALPLSRDPHSLTREDQQIEADRIRKREALTATWSPEQKMALRELFSAGEAFFLADVSVQEQWNHHVYRQGVSDALDDLFEQVRAFESGTLPEDADLATADHEMGTTLARLLRDERVTRSPQLESDLRESQARWTQFREAWARLGTARYSRTSLASWKTWITRERNGELRLLIGEK
jgi:hypothetical protein